MPRIFDNIDQNLLPALTQTLSVSTHADFCVGYFNLRGWKSLAPYIDGWPGGEGHCCRVLVGMQRLPQDEFRQTMSLIRRDEGMDNQMALRLKKKLAEEFRDQLSIGAPTNADEAGLRSLAAQIRAGKVVVKLFLRHQLHAKLYLLYREDFNNPITAYLGSSNLTLAGLSGQGELNVDVLEHPAPQTLHKWFEDRWNDRWCLDISSELAQIIEESWPREKAIPPYHIYIKMAYHLSQEARAGLSEFRIPRDFGNRLFEFQKAAVKIAAHHLNKRGGVLIGDVVGLGKTLMATAVARIFEDDYDLETLIICPKNLVKMWEDYRDQYRMRARVMSVSMVTQQLPELRRYRLVLIDESHNLRNREGKRYRAIQEYIEKNECKVILLSATPYNKTYLDLSSQLRLFVPEDKALGIRPEKLIRDMGETEFIRQYQCPVHSLAAFEKSPHIDDWRELMRLYMIRRTRSFIQANYAETDTATGRKYLTFADGSHSFFPVRQPHTARFAIRDNDAGDQYASLYDDMVVSVINALKLPRYGLGNYINDKAAQTLTGAEYKTVQDLSRAGRRLMGFCRTNLFKRLESSGHAFVLSVERHILRNYIYLYAIEKGKPLPIGTQDAGLLDTRMTDADVDADDGNAVDLFSTDESGNGFNGPETEDAAHASLAITEGGAARTEADFKRKAAEVYEQYAAHYQRRFKWLRPILFLKALTNDLRADAQALLGVLQRCGEWNPRKDAKLDKLVDLLTCAHPHDKVIIFTQFADTVDYLEKQLAARGVTRMAGVTGGSTDPTALAWAFSPVSNDKRALIRPENELRVLVATDVLSEGQNLQDCFVVVNYDLPWAIIRLIQRAGRVDRIGQKAETIHCYSFLPADGVERLIRLRSRVRQRLKENAEVVGTDEAFFEDDNNVQAVVDLYNENAGILDGEADSEVDLASYAYQIWKNAITANPALERIIPALSPVSYSTKTASRPEAAAAPLAGVPGVLVYVRTSQDNDALAWVDQDGNSVTESQLTILNAAQCAPSTPAQPRHPNHHELVAKAVELISVEEGVTGGQLGRPTGARFRVYERLKRHAEGLRGTLFESPELLKTIDEIYRFPLRQAATDTLNRQLRSNISDDDLAGLAIALRQEDRLCLTSDDSTGSGAEAEPRIICSLGLQANPPNEKGEVINR